MIDRRQLLAAAPAFAALAAGPALAGGAGPRLVVLDPQDPATPATLHELARTRGLTGVRFTGPVAEDYCEAWLDSVAAQKAWAAADELGLRVELPRSGVATARIAALATRFRRCRVMMS